MDTEKESKCLALKNIATSCKTYPITSVIFIILLLLPVALFASELNTKGISPAGFFTFLLTILLFFPMYIFIYVLKKKW